jgi:hypothetical protein
MLLEASMAGVESLMGKLVAAPVEMSLVQEDRSSWTTIGEDAFEVGAINNHSPVPTSQIGNPESTLPARGGATMGHAPLADQMQAPLSAHAKRPAAESADANEALQSFIQGMLKPASNPILKTSAKKASAPQAAKAKAIRHNGRLTVKTFAKGRRTSEELA